MDLLVQFVIMSAICVAWGQALYVPREFPTTASTQSLTSQTQTISVPARRSPESEIESERLARHQAESAVYSFGANVVDGIMDTVHLRQETREGLKLVGAYSYSDGYNKHTVYYEADENGYRIVKNVDEPIGNGPKINPDGTAEVSIDIDGNHPNKYTVHGSEIAHFQTAPADVVY